MSRRWGRPPVAARGQIEIVEDLPASQPRLVGRVAAADLEEIEGEERDQMAVRVVPAPVDAGGQKLEVSATVGGERYLLSVEHHITDRREAYLELREPVDAFAPGPGPPTGPGTISPAPGSGIRPAWPSWRPSFSPAGGAGAPDGAWVDTEQPFSMGRP
jgi:hypothetical protein